MLFSKIPGYSDLKGKLLDSHNSGRIGHALLFLGEEGSANLALAIAFAQFISCENKGQNDSCGTCRSCVKFEKNVHPDVHFYYPTATSKSVPKKALSHLYASQWRTFLNENLFVSLSNWLLYMESEQKEAIIPTDESLQIIKDLSLKSFESPFRFAIIWLPEKLNVQASNRLLKIIEEPPKNVFFFLVSENDEAILPTILSRTQILRIGKMTSTDLSKWLKDTNPGLSESDLTFALKYAEGNPLNASLALNKDSEQIGVTEDFIAWARLCYELGKKLPDLIKWSETMAGQKRNDQKDFLVYGMEFLRAGMLRISDTSELNHLYPEEEQHVSKFSALLNTKNVPLLIDEINSAIYNLERNANAKILFLNLSVKFGKLINPKNVNL